MDSTWKVLLVIGVVAFSLCAFVFGETFTKDEGVNEAAFLREHFQGVGKGTGFRTVKDDHEYIKELYHTHFDDNGTEKIPGDEITGMVYSYTGQVNKVSKVIHFNVSDKEADEQHILKVELCVKLPKPLAEKPRENHFTAPLTLFDVFNQKQASQALVRDFTHQWAVFPVRSLVKRWLRFPQTNLGIRITVNDTNTAQPESPITSNFSQYELVIYADQNPVQLPDTPYKRTRRSSGPSFVHKHKHLKCSRRDLYVNIRAVFGNWIILPAWYNAYTCIGSCPKTSSENPRAFTNYGLVLNKIMQITQADRNEAQEFCCVPSKFDSIAIIYRDQERKQVILRRIEELVVSECICSLKDSIQIFNSEKNHLVRPNSPPPRTVAAPDRLTLEP